VVESLQPAAARLLGVKIVIDLIFDQIGKIGMTLTIGTSGLIGQVIKFGAIVAVGVIGIIVHFPVSRSWWLSLSTTRPTIKHTSQMGARPEESAKKSKIPTCNDCAD
jgi:hypothetical protein